LIYSYLKLEKNIFKEEYRMRGMIYFACRRGKRQVWEYESYKRGIVLRFWGCNLRCPLCFAQAYAFRNERKSRRPCFKTLEQLIEEAIEKLSERTRWCRIEGGEPLLSSDHVNLVVKVVEKIFTVMGTKARIIIQTNGIWLGKDEENAAEFCRNLIGVVAKVRSDKRVVIEISFKGPNVQSAREYSGREDIDVLSTQIRAFNSVLDFLSDEAWEREINNIVVYPVAGFGPDPKLVLMPIDSCKTYVPLFHPRTWDQSYEEMIINKFKSTLSQYREVYKSYPHGDKIAMYGLECRDWQSAWLSKVCEDKILKMFILRHIRVDKKRLRKDFLRYLSPILEKIEVTPELLNRAKEVFAFYRHSRPKEHYPYL